jgi:hypothetical protein
MHDKKPMNEQLMALNSDESEHHQIKSDQKEKGILEKV